MAYVQKHDGIVLHTIVGVFEWERKAVRPLVFDLLLESKFPIDLTRAIIERQLTDWLIPCQYRLLEALAEYLTQRMLTEWQCKRVVLGIEKPGALGELARVGIRITRNTLSQPEMTWLSPIGSPIG
ncbi:bifunctional dihydroneopterin aldolase/dihydroneopterin triphosphate 2'-epimerase [mine drainage metagenome]|uniref:Bifunctional dihydroneopterin aldolase/dihydroneopterin triphosphate 2'-epimerase n=1 Tax=mine drainage metagenome TaxID=410659 RepID=A0A1J5RR22_9ZZZZ